jgi:geranylgeranyl diphosphate synthase type II
MLVKAYELMMEVPKDKFKAAMAGFNQTAAEVCEGQQYDMNFETQSEVSKTDYLEMIRLKTAVLLGYALKLGAILGGASDEVCENMYKIGVDAGLGFQLMDDILDVYGDPEKFGKQVGGDILSNKKTYLLLHALEMATGQEKEKLQKWLSAVDFDANQKIVAVTNIYNHLDVRAFCEEKMNSYFNNSFRAIEALKVPNDKKEILITFLKNLAQRDN